MLSSSTSSCFTQESIDTASERDSTWSIGSPSPPGLPRILVRAHFDVPGYGVGQPAVVVCKDKRDEPVLRMWYTDTTNFQNRYALICVLDSKNPAAWSVPSSWPEAAPTAGLPQYNPKAHLGGDPTSAPVETNAYTSSVDVKYDEVRDRYFLFYLATHKNQVAVRSSADGINWSDAADAIGSVSSQLLYDGRRAQIEKYRHDT